ncbi:MAG TPA: response regulator [Planktothrix sp.]
MIADSDSNVRALVGRFLTESGYAVTFATNGYEALDAARKSRPLAIFADILLPRLDGLALCRLLKSDPATAQVVTVIVLSVLAAEEKVKRAGADAYIQKPLERSRILATLEEAFTRSNTDG